MVTIMKIDCRLRSNFERATWAHGSHASAYLSDSIETRPCTLVLVRFQTAFNHKSMQHADRHTSIDFSKSAVSVTYAQAIKVVSCDGPTHLRFNL